MAISTKLKGFLDEHGVRYVSIVHSRAFTAAQIAASAHIKGKMLAKTVIVKDGGQAGGMVMAVLPASHAIDFAAITGALGGADVRLAGESEFAASFPGCEPGAMPPFGNLYGMRVLCDTALAEDREIFFNAGTHTEVIGVPFADFQRLVQPRMAMFAKHL
jgi:Ala-tRNA(Pro) deacylase